MLKIGQISRFEIYKVDGQKFTLSNQEGDCVDMPKNLAKLDHKIGEEVEAFIYLDTQNKTVATTRLPYAVVGEYAYLTVKEVHEFGAFFHWGTHKDLLVPGNEQKIKVQFGEDHIVRICLEPGTNRIFGTTKLGQFLKESETSGLKPNSKVEIIPIESTDLGFRCIVDKKYIGMIYHSEIFQDIYQNQVYPATVKKIREDGLIDLSLQSLGIRNKVEAKDKILDYIKTNNGKINFTDKSDPAIITKELQMSKKTFKNAVGMLYKARLIKINEDSIEIV